MYYEVMKLNVNPSLKVKISARTEKKDRGLFTSLYGRGWGVDCDEVVAGLYIGDKAAISNTAFLKKQEITHVLNAAEGRDEGEWWAVN